MIFNLYVGDFLKFTQSAKPGGTYAAAKDQLVFIEQVKHNIHQLKVTERLGFNESNYVNKMLVRTATDFLHFQEAAVSRVHEIYVSEMLTFTEHVYRVRPAADTLRFHETVVGLLAKVGRDTLTFTEQVIVKRIANVHVNEILTFSEGAKAYKPSICYIGNPTPALGDNPTVIYSCTLPDSTVLSITMPAPSWDNTESYDNQTAKNTTKGGDLLLFRDPDWTKKYELKYMWDHLYSTQVVAMQDFILRTLGLVVTLIDYENRVWNGIITSPQVPFRQKSGANRTYELTLELL